MSQFINSTLIKRCAPNLKYIPGILKLKSDVLKDYSIWNHYDKGLTLSFLNQQPLLQKAQYDYIKSLKIQGCIPSYEGQYYNSCFAFGNNTITFLSKDRKTVLKLSFNSNKHKNLSLIPDSFRKIVPEVLAFGISKQGLYWIIEQNCGIDWFYLIYNDKLQSGINSNISIRLKQFSELVSMIYAFHEQGLVHRDIKPENVFVHLGTGALRLGDFDTVETEQSLKEKSFSEKLKEIYPNAVGTPKFSSPESNKIRTLKDWNTMKIDDWKAHDVYALGVILHIIIFLRPPKKISTGELTVKSDIQFDLLTTLMQGMLCSDPIYRITIKDVKKTMNVILETTKM